MVVFYTTLAIYSIIYFNEAIAVAMAMGAVMRTAVSRYKLILLIITCSLELYSLVQIYFVFTVIFASDKAL